MSLSSASPPPHVLVEVVDGVGHVRLNRPEVRNALSDPMKAALADAFTRFAEDADVRAVLITAAGAHFMVGADLRQFHAELTADPVGHAAAFEQRVLATSAILAQLRTLPKPVVLAAQGQVVGIGFCLAALADLVVAADDAQFMLAYCHIGLSPDAGITWTLPRIVGERRAKQIAFLGERIDAQTAHEWGFVNEVVPAARLEDSAWTLARRLAAGASRSLAASKDLLGRAFDTGWDEQVRREARMISELVPSDDHREGLAAFLERRKPVFRGR